MAGVPEAAAAAAQIALGFVPGIEITAVENGHDVHILGYWIDGASPELARLLEGLRRARARARSRDRPASSGGRSAD